MKDKNKTIAVIGVGIAMIVVAVIVIATISSNNKSDGGNSRDNADIEGNSKVDDVDPDADSNAKIDAVVGKWEYMEYLDSKSPDIEFVYKFEPDGTGSYYAAGTDMPFTYTIDGNRISIIYDSGPFETEYEIDGDVLNIKDSNGNDTLYKKAG